MRQDDREELLGELRAAASSAGDASPEEVSALAELARRIRSLGDEPPPREAYLRGRERLLGYLDARQRRPLRWLGAALSEPAFLRAAAALLLASTVGLSALLATGAMGQEGATRENDRSVAPATADRSGALTEPAPPVQPGAPGGTDGAVFQDGVRAYLVARVEEALDGGYRIGGRLVRTTGETNVTGEVKVGSLVAVEGEVAQDNAIVAGSIQVQEEGVTWVMLRGTVEEVLPDGLRVAGRRVVFQGGPQETVIRDPRVPVKSPPLAGPQAVAPGSLVTVDGLLQPDGSVLARGVAVEEYGVVRVTVMGKVEAVVDGGYQVAGRRLTVGPETSVLGDIQVGTSVMADGVLQEDGTILASSIVAERAVPPEPMPLPEVDGGGSSPGAPPTTTEGR